MVLLKALILRSGKKEENHRKCCFIKKPKTDRQAPEEIIIMAWKDGLNSFVHSQKNFVGDVSDAEQLKCNYS